MVDAFVALLHRRGNKRAAGTSIAESVTTKSQRANPASDNIGASWPVGNKRYAKIATTS